MRRATASIELDKLPPLVADAREGGTSGNQLGALLGISASGAHEQFS